MAKFKKGDIAYVRVKVGDITSDGCYASAISQSGDYKLGLQWFSDRVLVAKKKPANFKDCKMTAVDGDGKPVDLCSLHPKKKSAPKRKSKRSNR